MIDKIKIIDIKQKKITKSSFNKNLKFNGLLIIRNFFQEKEIKNELEKFNKKKKIIQKYRDHIFIKRKIFQDMIKQ